MPEKNWPNPDLPGVPMFPDHSARHVLENKKRRSLKLVLWDHEQEHYCTEIGWVTPKQMNGLDWEYHGPILTPTQIKEMLAAERERCADVCHAMSVDNFYEKPERVVLEAAGIAIRNLGAAP